MSSIKVIGYTTGVFDLFHIGHLNLLINASKLCDHLIVGVTTDELSINFKSKKPIISFDERINIVRAIKYVDTAVAQEDMNKYNAWKKYKFNVMFASQEPTNKWPEVEKKFLENFKDDNSPRIILLPRTDGVSSTIRRSMLKYD
jgi:glycerol-3-phosphate cytidylyltransferase